MYKVLIVDDERPIIQGMKLIIDWEAYGFNIVGEAYNGLSGVEEAQKLQPDVVITDIRMPLMNGHEMIDRIKIFLPECRFIILSGYHEFEYAKKALESNVSSYLLKPLQPDELTVRLKKIKTALDMAISRKREYQELRAKLQASMPVVRNSFLNELSESNLLRNDEVMRKWNFLNTGYSLNSFCHMVLEIDDLSFKYGENPEDQVLTSFAVNNILNELVEDAQAGILFTLSEGRLSVLCCRKGDARIDKSFVTALATKVHDTVKSLLGETVTIGISRIHTDITDLPLSFHQAKKALKYRLLFGEDSIIHIDEVISLGAVVVPPMELERKLVDSIELGRAEEAQAILDELFRGFTAERGYQPEMIFSICLEIAVLVSRCTVLSGVELGPSATIGSNVSVDLAEIKTIERLKEYMDRMVTNACDTIRSSRAIKAKGIIWDIKDFVEKHYDEELTLDLLAGKFFINACYLSQLFKKEFNCGFLDFLTRFRVEKAQRLLLQPELKVYEVGSMVGYSNQRYFSKVFEKLTGYTPNEYRKKQGMSG